MNKTSTRIVLFLLVSSLIFSCVPNRKLIYMQELNKKTGPVIESSERYAYSTEEYLLQINDIVEVSIKTTDPELNKVFSAVTLENNNMAQMAGGQGASDVFFMNGYTIDDQGMVEIPLVGEVKFLGLTTKEAKELVESKVKQYIRENEYFVRVRLGGIRFSALGEFNQSGKFTILQNRVTILEAIAHAGDLGRLAKRNEVLLVRQYPDGSQIHKINLLDRKLLASEFYFIRPNDIIYAEPMKVREIGTGNTLFETFTLVTSAVTALALLYTLYQNR